MSEPSSALLLRIHRFLGKSAKEQWESVRFRVRKLLPARSTIISLPFGARWALEDSALDRQLRSGIFESAEAAFVMSFLRRGMTVLDVGAHHGFYTLLASIRVGQTGKVFAFEPSPRERKRLEQHMNMNNCRNVQIVPLAVGASHGEATLFLVEGAEDYCNSLRPPAVEAGTRAVRVEINSLDEMLASFAVQNVDFIKLDVEGAELEALKGASHLLQAEPRPVLLVEVYDVRTEPWGYRAKEIVNFLDASNYRWFRLSESGIPEAVAPDCDAYDTNLVAIPGERVSQVLANLAEGPVI